MDNAAAADAYRRAQAAELLIAYERKHGVPALTTEDLEKALANGELDEYLEKDDDGRVIPSKAAYGRLKEQDGP